MLIADQPINTDQPTAQPQTIDFAELGYAIADLTQLVDYLAATKTLRPSEAAALRRLHELVEKLQSD